MTRKNIIDKIFLVEFDSSVEAAKTFLRFQEYYESPEFKGKIFKLKHYIKWYKTQTDDGKFTYYHDWSGFNIPSYVLAPFYDGTFKNLSKREKQLLEMFKEDAGDFYIIGVQKGKSDTLKHEIMHGLYYTNEDYRGEVIKSINFDRIFKLQHYKKLENLLEEYGYHDSVFLDEMHAYLVTCQENLIEHGIELSIFDTIIRALELNYDKYTKQYANILTIS